MNKIRYVVKLPNGEWHDNDYHSRQGRWWKKHQTGVHHPAKEPQLFKTKAGARSSVAVISYMNGWDNAIRAHMPAQFRDFVHTHGSRWSEEAQEFYDAMDSAYKKLNSDEYWELRKQDGFTIQEVTIA